MGRKRRTSNAADAPPGASPELIEALRAVSPTLTEPPAGDHRQIIARLRWFRLIHEAGLCPPDCARCEMDALQARVVAQRDAANLEFMRTHSPGAEPRPWVADPREHGWKSIPGSPS